MKKELIKLIENVNDEKLIRTLYHFVKAVIKKGSPIK